MQPIGNAVIAAAGLGSRLGLGTPKAMLEINGITILTRLIDSLEKQVDTLHVVVGYREELIIQHCARHHPKVVIVRNPEYRNTNTAQSFELGAQHLKGKTLFLDGDLVFAPGSLEGFINEGRRHESLLGICKPGSEKAVYVNSAKLDGSLSVTGFSSTSKTDYEWANIVAGDAQLFRKATGYVYEFLSPHLPIPAFEVLTSEIDTPADLSSAIAFISKHNL